MVYQVQAKANFVARYERLFSRIDKAEVKFKPLVFPWGRSSLKAAEVGHAAALECPAEDAERLIAMLDRLDQYGRSTVATLLVGGAAAVPEDERTTGGPKFRSPAARAAVVAMLGDPASHVREQVGGWLDGLPRRDDEAAQHETLLSRSASDIRTRAISRLAKLPDEQLLAAAGRLLDGTSTQQLGGLELLRQMVAAERCIEKARALAQQHASRQKKEPSKELRTALDAVLLVRKDANWTLQNALGLLPDGWKHARPIAKMRENPQEKVTKRTVELLESLEAFIEKHKDVDVRKSRDGEEDHWKSQPGLLGARSHHGLDPDLRHTREQDLAFCPVAVLLDEWQAASGPAAKDPMELLRAWVACKVAVSDWRTDSHAWSKDVVALGMAKKTKVHSGMELFLEWALRRGDERPGDLLLDQMEGAIARGDIYRKGDDDDDKVPAAAFDLSAQTLQERWRQCPAAWHAAYEPERLRRLLRLCDAAEAAFVPFIDPKRSGRYSDDSVYTCPVQLTLDEFVALWELGELTDHDVTRRLIQVPESEYEDRVSHHELDHLMEQRAGRNLRWVTRRAPDTIDPILERIRKRALEIELPRGDAETSATSVIFALFPSGGIDAVIPALAGLGKHKLVRGYNWSGTSKAASFSRILAKSRPGKSDTPQAFAAAAKGAAIPESRLVELALYARSGPRTSSTRWAGRGSRKARCGSALTRRSRRAKASTAATMRSRRRGRRASRSSRPSPPTAGRMARSTARGLTGARSSWGPSAGRLCMTPRSTHRAAPVIRVRGCSPMRSRARRRRRSWCRGSTASGTRTRSARWAWWQ